jgi:hypothetical protein
LKRITNKQTSIMTNDAGGTTYADLCMVCVNRMPDGGFTVDDMRKRFRVIDQLDKADGHIEVEDADYALLKTLVNGFRWPAMSAEIVEFVDDVNNAGKAPASDNN